MGRSQRHRVWEQGFSSRGAINEEGAVSGASGFIVDAAGIGQMTDNPNINGTKVAGATSGGPLGGSTNSGAIPVGTAFPIISDISPTTHANTGAASNLTVNGSNFAVGCKIMINGVEATTTRVNSGQCTTSVTWTGQTIGTKQITIKQGGVESNAISLAITA